MWLWFQAEADKAAPWRQGFRLPGDPGGAATAFPPFSIACNKDGFWRQCFQLFTQMGCWMQQSCKIGMGNLRWEKGERWFGSQGDKGRFAAKAKHDRSFRLAACQGWKGFGLRGWKQEGAGKG